MIIHTIVDGMIMDGSVRDSIYAIAVIAMYQKML